MLAMSSINEQEDRRTVRWPYKVACDKAQNDHIIYVNLHKGAKGKSAIGLDVAN